MRARSLRSPGRGSPRPPTVLLAVVFAAACGDGGSTELGSPPTAMVQLSAPVDTVVTGDRTDPPISVRVEDALGNPVEGVPVRFEVARGDGIVSPGVAVSSQGGIAESLFEAGAIPGEAEITVDIPSAPHVPEIRFLVLAQAADSVLLSVVEGDGQRAEAGSQLPLPFVVQARTTGGSPAGGVEVAFRLPAAGSGVLTDAAVLTGADGRAGAVLTLGRQPREIRIRAFAGGGVYSDTLELTATALARIDGSVALDSTGSGGLVSGAEAVLFGRGFSPVPEENDVRIEGESAEILAASSTRLTIRVPDFTGLCLPLRDVGVRVLVGGDASNGALWPLLPAESLLRLEVGDAVTRRGPGPIHCLQLPAGEEGREYRVIVADPSRSPGQHTRLQLATRVPAESAGAAGPASSAAPPPDGTLREAVRDRARPDLTIRTRALAELTGSRVAVSRGTASPAGIPVVGDTLVHTFALRGDLTASCSDTTEVVRSRVRAVGRHLVLAEDLGAPAGGLGAEDWSELGAELDRFVAPVDTAYFGPWADLDGNGRAIVLFTPKVNQLAAGEGRAGVRGFFLPLDLAARTPSAAGGGSGGICPASNEGEILYLAAADPEGRYGPPLAREAALREARALVAHELQHLINAERRVLRSPGGFGAVEEGWLDEALSHLAEEIVGLASLGLASGGDYTFDQVANTGEEFEAFRTYQLDNFLHLSLYLADPSGAAARAGEGEDEIEGLRARGFGWFLARWLADQASDERAFLRSVVDGGRNVARGTANLERVTGREWPDLLADFSVTLAADDAGIERLAGRHRVATWDFRDVFTSLSQSTTAGTLFPAAFPLRATPLPVETAALDLDVGASSVRYFALATGPGGPPMSIAIRTAAGGPRNQTTEPQVTIVRMR